MMTDYDITDLESTVKSILRTAGVSQHVWGNRPKSTSPTKDDFCVVSVSGPLRDVFAYGTCVVRISFFTKDVDGLKNDKKMSLMYKAFLSGFPARSGRYIFGQTPNVLGDVADDFGYHARIIQITVTIKATN